VPLTQRARSYASGVNGTYSLRQERTERLPERLTLVEAAAIAEVHAGGLRSNQPRASAAPLCGADRFLLGQSRLHPTDGVSRM
jgi:hypothetical protein